MTADVRRNRLDIAPQALLLSVGVILSVILISIMVIQFEQARKLADAVSENMLAVTEEISNSDVMRLDGEKVTGADVRNFCKRYLLRSEGPERVAVVKGAASVFYSEYEECSDMKDATSPNYVDPTDLYICEVSRNANGVITEVKFIYQ